MFEMRTVGASPTFAARKQPFDFSVEAIPPGFKVIRLEFGKVFYYEVCDQPVNTRQSCPRCDTMPRLVRPKQGIWSLRTDYEGGGPSRNLYA